MIRVFMNGTAFYVTEINPYDLMGQRGNEVRLVTQLDDLVYNETELRRAARQSGCIDEDYINTMFDTVAEETPWYATA